MTNLMTDQGPVIWLRVLNKQPLIPAAFTTSRMDLLGDTTGLMELAVTAHEHSLELYYLAWL
jgi:hypothetical protein